MRYIIIAYEGDAEFSYSEHSNSRIARLLCWFLNRRARSKSMAEKYTVFYILDKTKLS